MLVVILALAIGPVSAQSVRESDQVGAVCKGVGPDRCAAARKRCCIYH
jgi:hypothetical protein